MSSNIIPMAELLPSKDVWNHWKSQGEELIKSGFLPDAIKTPAQFMAIVLKGRECGVPPMQSCSHINIIKGKPAMSAELMLSQILKNCPGSQVWFPVRTNERCEVRCIRSGKEHVFSYTIEDAKRAGLTNKQSWQYYPRAMLHARVVSEMARSVYPDCINGISYTPEELGAEVNDDGEIIEIEATKSETQKKPVVENHSSPVDKAPAKTTGNASPEASPVFSTKNPQHLAWANKFLQEQKNPGLMEVFVRALDGKPLTKESILKEWDLINPDAPDKEPESGE